MNAIGQGVQRNEKEAYAWASVAAANGHTIAFALRDDIARSLTKKSLEEAQALASEYFRKYSPSR